MDLKLKVLRLLNKKECTDNALFLPVATAVYAVEPSAPAAYAIGIGFAKSSQLDSSFTYMEDAVSRCGDCAEQVTYLLKTGQIASAMGRTGTAKRYARKCSVWTPTTAMRTCSSATPLLAVPKHATMGLWVRVPSTGWRRTTTPRPRE